MKKTFSVSAHDKVIEDFTQLAKEFGTNRTALISMFMVDVIQNKTIYFKRSSDNDTVVFENFSTKQLHELEMEGGKSLVSIQNSLQSI